MTEPDDQIQQKPARTPPPKLSVLAVTALVIAAIPCCPLVNLLGAMLGITAMRRIQMSRGLLGGRRVAAIAIAIGLGLAVLLSVAGMTFSYREQQRLESQMVASIEGFIRAVEDGRSDKAQQFLRPGTNKGESGDVLAAFGEQMKLRFGALDRVSIASQSNSGSLLAPTIEAACVYAFESTQRTGSAAFQLTITGKSIWPDLRLIRLRVDDPESGPVAFPAEIR
jgi:hypothetical protein